MDSRTGTDGSPVDVGCSYRPRIARMKSAQINERWRVRIRVFVVLFVDGLDLSTDMERTPALRAGASVSGFNRPRRARMKSARINEKDSQI
jgi:hypothetical protein